MIARRALLVLAARFAGAMAAAKLAVNAIPDARAATWWRYGAAPEPISKFGEPCFQGSSDLISWEDLEDRQPPAAHHRWIRFSAPVCNHPDGWLIARQPDGSWKELS